MNILVGNFTAQFDLNREVQRGILEGVFHVGSMQIEQSHRINFVMQMMPRVSWAAAFMQSKIMASAADLRVIIDDYAHGRVAVREMANLLTISELKDNTYVETEFISIESDHNQANTIRMKFRVLETSKDTSIYRVNPFTYWENLTALPTLMEYKGSEYLIHNEENNCIKAIDKPSRLVVDEQCTTSNHTDPKVQIWKPIIQTRNLDRFDETCQVKKTMNHNYIYCFPYNITLSAGTFRMPPNVFRLQVTEPFEIAGLPKYIPKIREFNVAPEHDLSVIDSIHVGQFPLGSDVIDQSKWFDRIQELLALNEQYSFKEQSSVVVTKYGTVWWLVIIAVIILIKITIILSIMLNRHRIESMRQPQHFEMMRGIRHEFNSKQASSNETSQRINQEIQSKEKSRIEVGRDESITINLNRTVPCNPPEYLKSHTAEYSKDRSL